MKQIVLISFLLLASFAAEAQYSRDRAAVTSVIEAIGVFVDFGEFEAICQLYEPISSADYSSLWNNKPTSGSPSNRATGWSGFIPGFDQTRHEIDVKHVQIRDNVASAVALVRADHWLSGEKWSIVGTYTVELKKRDDRWRISDWVFTLKDETGERSLVDRAEEIAESMFERPIACPDE